MHQAGPTKTRWLAAAWAAGFLAACSEEPPPTSVNEFLENRILLEAIMVRCVQNRAEARYDPECINAREAVDRIAVAEEEARRADLERQSERKRQALRRAQEAAAEARQRAEEEERRRREAELLGEFEPVPGRETESGLPVGEEPVMPQDTAEPGAVRDPDTGVREDVPTGTRPDPEMQPAAGETGDLETIRQQLKRRQDDSGRQ